MTELTEDDTVPARADKAALLAKREAPGTVSGYPEDDVPVPGFGTVRVRGLSRFEVLHIQSNHGKGVAAVEQLTVSLGLIDPPMTEAEVKVWQKVDVSGEIDPVTQRIGELSGMIRGADKEAYKSVRDESDD